MANTLTSIEVYPGDVFALPTGIYTTNHVLAADVAESITVPTWTDSSGTTRYAQVAVFNATADFYIAGLTGAAPDIDIVTNGAFASDTAFTKGTGWTIAAGVASSDGTQAGDADLEQDPANLKQNRYYSATFTVSGYSAGNVTPVVGDTEGTDRAANGTFTETILAGSGNAVALRADLNFVGNVDNFSVTPIARVPLADITSGYGVDLNPTQVFVGRVSTISIVAPAATKVSIKWFR